MDMYYLDFQDSGSSCSKEMVFLIHVLSDLVLVVATLTNVLTILPIFIFSKDYEHESFTFHHAND